MRNILNRLFNGPNWHNLRSVNPLSQSFGSDRGTPIDRVYMEDFMQKNRKYITGSTLEIAEDYYSRKFGVNVINHAILHATDDNNQATIVGDLTDTETLTKNKIDCFICTQTFNFIYDFRAAIKGGRYLLKPGGYLLATVAGISQISRYDMDRWGDYWRFNTLSMLKSFEDVFGEGNVEVDYYGNVLTATSLLQGISAQELNKDEIFYKDPNYQVLITIVAKKVDLVSD